MDSPVAVQTNGRGGSFYAARNSALAACQSFTLSQDPRRKAITRLNIACLLKESFSQLWGDQTKGWARAFVERGRPSLRGQRLTPYEKFAAMIERHWEGIASY